MLLGLVPQVSPLLISGLRSDYLFIEVIQPTGDPERVSLMLDVGVQSWREHYMNVKWSE